MTTVAEGLTWAGEGARIMRYLRARDEERPLVELWFLAAVDAADAFLGGRDFTDPALPTRTWIAGLGYEEDPDEVLVDVPVPNMVRLGVYEYVRQCRIISTRQGGIVQESTGAVSESRDLWAARNMGDVPLSVARGYWLPYVLDGTTQGGAPKL